MHRLAKITRKELLEMPAIEVYKLVLNGEISRFPTGFWEQPEAQQNAKYCTQYLFENILGLTIEDIKNYNGLYTMFEKNKLGAMINKIYNASPFLALKDAYPNNIKNPWDLKNVSKNTWQNKTDNENSTEEIPNTIENCIIRIKDIFENKLHWITDDDIKNNINANVLMQNGLSSILQDVCHSSPYELVNLAYPNRFQQWELNRVPQGYWNDNNIITAIKWLVEIKLGITPEQALTQLKYKDFVNNGLATLTNIKSINELLKLAYPELFNNINNENQIISNKFIYRLIRNKL